MKGEERKKKILFEKNYFFWEIFFWVGTAVPLQAQAVPRFWQFWLKIFFFLRFLESCSDNDLQNNLKQTKSD